VDLSGEALDSLNTCHHPEEGQILTTTEILTLGVIPSPLYPGDIEKNLSLVVPKIKTLD